MTRSRRWRLRPILFLGVVAALVPALFIAEQGAERILRRELNGVVEPARVAEILHDLRLGFLPFAIVALFIGAVLAIWLSDSLVRGLRRLHADTLARSKGKHSISRSRVRELHQIGSAIDMLATELEQRQDSLARERDELARLVGSVSEGILQVGPSGRIVHANPAARMFLGIREDGIGQPLSAFVRLEELRVLVERAVIGEETTPREVTVDERRLLVHAKPVRSADTNDRTAGAVIAFTDLTQLRRLEGVRRDFVANVSHELKTPLTSIRGYAETLLGDDLPADLQRQFLEVIQNNAERLHGIVEDLLDLSRLESGGWRPEPATVDPLDLARDVWAGFGDRLGRKHIDFVPIGDDSFVVADRGGLQHVLSNLFDNAIRYTPDGGRITVRVQAIPRTRNGAAPASRGSDSHLAERGTQGWVVVEIHDTGSGIPQDALPRIFERFYRVDPARSRADGGTGLGLSIVKHLVESMSGEVTAESELGKGTTLRLRLPSAD